MILGNCIIYRSGLPVPDSYINKTVTSISNTKATAVRERTFMNNPDLTSIYLPNVETIGTSAFASCTSLASVSFPKVTEIGFVAFYGCSSLESAVFPLCTNIKEQAFRNVKSGFALHLLANTVCALENTNAFQGVSIFSVYVPAVLVDSYKAAQYWSTYANKIYAEP